jgi:SAM-dependent methyltransferase
MRPRTVQATKVAAPLSSLPNFDRVALVYRWMEYLSFGSMLERCRFQFLNRCAKARHALVLGDGDGRFTARLFRVNPIVKVDAVDGSTAMLAALRRRALIADVRADARLQTIHADLRSWTPDGNAYDLVVSHFFLDCLTDQDVQDLVRRVVPHLAPNAEWLVSEFAVPPGRWRARFSRLLIRFLYFAFARWTGLEVKQIPDFAAAFKQHGFQRMTRATFQGGLLTSEVWERAAF